MKKIKLFLCVALFGAMSYGAFTAYDHYTMNEEERFLLANIEALTNDEESDGNFKDNCYHVICNVRCVGTSGKNWGWAIAPGRVCPECSEIHGM